MAYEAYEGFKTRYRLREGVEFGRMVYSSGLHDRRGHVAGGRASDQADSPSSMGRAIVPHIDDLHDQEGLTIPSRETQPREFGGLVTAMVDRVKMSYEETRGGLENGSIAPMDHELRYARDKFRSLDEADADAAQERELARRRGDGVERLSQSAANATAARRRVERYRRQGKTADFVTVLQQIQDEQDE